MSPTGYTYPAPAAITTADIIQIHAFMASPTQIARRLRTVLQQRYIADALLKGRFVAQGGGVFYETGESIFTGEDARPVAPGGEYPLVSIGGGGLASARTTKWGQDSEVTDEAIARLLRNPVDRALTKLANQNVKTIDGVALAVIQSAVTQTVAAKAAWAGASADQILGDVLGAQADITTLGEGYLPDTVALDDRSWLNAMIAFVKAGWLPRESIQDNPALTGQFPVIGGMTWLKSPHFIAGTVVVADTEQLGGMADEDLHSPGYVSAAGPGTAPVQVKSIRDDDEDAYRLRARRVTVPVVLEPRAAKKITGV